MPNDCYNYLEAPDGDISLIADYFSTRKRAYSKLPDTFLDFTKIVRAPKKLSNPYDWCVENWGTRSNSYDGQVTEDGISFNTAWSPPSQAIAALANQINQPLRMVYDEPGMDFCGEVLAYPDGTYEDNCYSPRGDAPDNLREELMIDEEKKLNENFK